jgi:hypothetical protein
MPFLVPGCFARFFQKSEVLETTQIDRSSRGI